ncbi:MAG: hypothetical protein ABFD54_04155 [Armatimonadota bacterium]|nr:YjbH domain-containing protein [bacterium]
MRTLVLIMALIVCLAGSVSANRILLAPSGETLTTGQIRAEAAISPGNDDGKYFWLGAGLMQLEVSALRFENSAGDDQDQFSAQWNFLPETMITPAVAFGVQDVTDNSDDGIAGYAVVTKHLAVGRFNPVIKSLAATAGVGFGGIDGPFFGLEAKLPYGFFAQAEYDSRDFNAAFGWQPISALRLKGYTIRDEFYVGAELQPFQF